MDDLSLFASLFYWTRAVVWGPPLLLLVAATGFYLTWTLKGIQVRGLWPAVRSLFEESSGGHGELSHFQALMTALASAIGTGSIAGVATALALGGAGALFWMWFVAIIGMATSYAESLLSIKYRRVESNGRILGGPMYFLRDGLSAPKLATLFALFACLASFGIGSSVQANSVASALQQTYHIPPLWTGLALVALTTLVMLGGVGVVGRLASVIVPFMAIGYIGTGICVLARYSDLVWPAFQSIFYEAMHGSAVLGGLAGGGILLALQLGVSRGICSNESGLGSTAIAAAAARTDCAVRQGLLAMLGPLVATLGVCSITGLVLIVTGSLDGVWNHSISLQGSALVVQAFGDNVPLGDHIVTFGLLFFAYSTTMAWSYYGVQCAEYLAGRRLVNLYRIVYVFLLLPGAIGSVQAVWAFADTMNGLMAIPNLIGVFALRKVVRNETKRYFSKVSSALHVQEVKG